MNRVKSSIVLALMLSALVACGKKDAGTGAEATAACNLVSTKDGSPLAIKAVATDTPEAKQFLETCKNPYTAKYAADPAAALVKPSSKGATDYGGRHVMTNNNCTGCHGGNLGGLMAPSLVKNGGTGAYDTKWIYEKNATDKGMFETIAGGTPGTSGGVMLIWHQQITGHTGEEGLSTDDILKAVGYIRSVYKGDGEKTWMK